MVVNSWKNYHMDQFINGQTIKNYQLIITQFVVKKLKTCKKNNYFPKKIH